MKKNFLSIFTFLLGIQFLIGQNSNNTLNDWDKIIIIDAYHGWSSFENKLQIKKQDLWVTPLEKPDSIIKKIDPKLVNDLVKLIKRTNYDSTSFQKKPLISFGRDSLWLLNNAEKLWKEHIINRETPKEIDSIAISTIKNYQKANQAASFLEGSNWTDDYPFVVIGIIKDNDTITVHSNGQYPYMLPWYTKKGRIYDSKISELITQLLPDATPSNKERLSGEGFNSSFIGKTYELFIAEKENYLEAKNKYPKTFKLLEKEFEITRAEIMDMSSIEWGRLLGRWCLDMSLKDVTISKNIQFNTISGVNEVFSTKRSIISKKKYLINLLKENPVYKYTLNCKDCLGEIHWVKSKSFSQKAKKNFKEYLEEQDIDKNKYNGRYKDAIFYELTENRGSERSFSRWIFLKDGTFILWQLKGSFLMDFPKDSFKERGYICKEIKF